LKWNLKKLLLVFLVVFLVGCQAIEIAEEEPVVISDEEAIIDQIGENFDDNLDDALKELEEIESI